MTKTKKVKYVDVGALFPSLVLFFPMFLFLLATVTFGEGSELMFLLGCLFAFLSIVLIISGASFTTAYERPKLCKLCKQELRS